MSETAPSPEAAPVTFESFGLRSEVLSALKSLGYEEPTPIQRETIPALISGRDVLGQAATGTGKTAAFALPILEKLTREDRRPFEAQALVLVPTRELAMQVAEALQKYGAGLGVVAVPVYGGQEIFQQIKPLKRGADVVIATPGRALDHIKRKSLLLKNVKVVVLDEADEMLDMGFEEDLQLILNELPEERQTALFSATLAPRIAKIAEKHLKNPMRVAIAARSVEAGTAPNIRQAAYIVKRGMKEAALMRVLEWETPASAIIFCRTRNEVEELTHVLMRGGYEPAALHGGLTQEQRDAVLRKFKEGELRVLVATDVAARGLHVENLSHVINFDLPTSPEVYVHRIGRTGRAGKDGVALSFVDPREQRLLGNVERLLKKKVSLQQVPTRQQLDAKRAQTVAEQVKAAAETPELAPFNSLVAELGLPAEQVAAAAMMLLQQKMFPAHKSDEADLSSAPVRGGDRGERGPRREPREPREPRSREGMVQLWLSIGERAGVRPQDIVGAIANEADVPSKNIVGVRISEMDTRVEVPAEVADKVIAALLNTRIRGRKLRAERAGAPSRDFGGRPPRSFTERTDAAPASEDTPSAALEREHAAAPARAAEEPQEASGERSFGAKKSFGGERSFGAKKSFGAKREFGEKKSFGEKREFGGERSFGAKKEFGAKREFGEKKSFGEKREFGGERSFGAKKDFGAKREFGEKKSFGEKREFGGERSFGAKKDFGAKREFGEKKSFGEKREFGGERSFGAKKDFGAKREFGEKREFGGERSFGAKKSFAPKPGDRFKPKPRHGRMEPKKR